MEYLWGYRLPYFMSKRLFGDRKQFGLTCLNTDPCWVELQKHYVDFYTKTQQENKTGSFINSKGYLILKQIDLDNKIVAEIGPGSIEHIHLWGGKPNYYYAIDMSKDFLNLAISQLQQYSIDYNTKLLCNDKLIDIPSKSVDIVLSFYSMEHLHPLPHYVSEINRILKPRGLLIGAIPIEGGLSWGVGRYLTTRRYLLKHTNINPDKIICWAHPNFADDIIRTLDGSMRRLQLSHWPFNTRFLDISLISKFIYQKN